MVGNELSEIAIKALFEDLELTPKITVSENFICYQANSITIFVGDFFDLTREVILLLRAEQLLQDLREVLLQEVLQVLQEKEDKKITYVIKKVFREIEERLKMSFGRDFFFVVKKKSIKIMHFFPVKLNPAKLNGRKKKNNLFPSKYSFMKCVITI